MHCFCLALRRWLISCRTVSIFIQKLEIRLLDNISLPRLKTPDTKMVKEVELVEMIVPVTTLGAETIFDLISLNSVSHFLIIDFRLAWLSGEFDGWCWMGVEGCLLLLAFASKGKLKRVRKATTKISWIFIIPIDLKAGGFWCWSLKNKDSQVW